MLILLQAGGYQHAAGWINVQPGSVGRGEDDRKGITFGVSQYRGGLEVTITYKDLLNSRRRAKGPIPCPKFGGHMPNTHYIGY